MANECSFQHEAAGALPRVRAEQTHARRVAAQLRSLLAELAELRTQVRPADLPRFDALTQHSRDLTLKAIVDYLGNSPRLTFPHLASSNIRIHTHNIKYLQMA